MPDDRKITGEAMGRGAFEIAESIECVSRVEVISVSIASTGVYTAIVRERPHPHRDLGFTSDFHFPDLDPPLPNKERVRKTRRLE